MTSVFLLFYLHLCFLPSSYHPRFILISSTCIIYLYLIDTLFYFTFAEELLTGVAASVKAILALFENAKDIKEKVFLLEQKKT